VPLFSVGNDSCSCARILPVVFIRWQRYEKKAGFQLAKGLLLVGQSTAMRRQEQPFCKPKAQQ
ncbi:hypothetical protein, partial [Segatella baroniae]|uniref:hypothetical protein n=1 Tax=Segatella baroniae TaxID=305719 RepID=UPI0028E6ADA2